MGFEQELSFASLLDSPTLERLLACVKIPPTWRLVRAEQEGETHILRYVLDAGKIPKWEQDFLVYLSEQKLYVLVHSATGDQEEEVLGWLQKCLHTSGLFGLEFQEP